MSIVISQSIRKIASAMGVDGMATTVTALTFESGIDLSNYVGILAYIKWASGTITGCGIVIENNGSSNSGAVISLNGIDANNDLTANLFGIWRDTGSIDVNVRAGSVVPSTFDVYVYGIARIQ